MRIGRHALAVDFAPEIEDAIFREAPFHERARVHARRGMPLEINQVAAVSFVRRMPEMLLAGAEERADRGEARDMAAELVIALVRARHQHHRVPAADGADALLERHIAGRALLHVRRNRVDVRRVGRERDVGTRATRLVDQPLEQVVRSLRALALENRLESVEPLLGL